MKTSGDLSVPSLRLIFKAFRLIVKLGIRDFRPTLYPLRGGESAFAKASTVAKAMADEAADKHAGAVPRRKNY